MTRIVTSAYRYKRPPRRKKPVSVAVPAIVAIPKKRGRKIAVPPSEIDADPEMKSAPATPANDDRQPAEGRRTKSAIVNVRRPGRRFADVPDMTPEEHRRVGDLADALWRDMVRRIADKDQP